MRERGGGQADDVPYLASRSSAATATLSLALSCLPTPLPTITATITDIQFSFPTLDTTGHDANSPPQPEHLFMRGREGEFNTRHCLHFWREHNHSPLTLFGWYRLLSPSTSMFFFLFSYPPPFFVCVYLQQTTS